MIRQPSQHLVEGVLARKRIQPRMVTSLLTRYGYLKKYLHKIWVFKDKPYVEYIVNRRKQHTMLFWMIKSIMDENFGILFECFGILLSWSKKLFKIFIISIFRRPYKRWKKYLFANIYTINNIYVINIILQRKSKIFAEPVNPKIIKRGSKKFFI